MLKILRQVENISACRDRDILAASIVAAVRETFPARTVTLLRLSAIDSETGELVARADDSGLTVVSGDSLDPPAIVPTPPRAGDRLRAVDAGLPQPPRRRHLRPAD